MLLRKRHYMHCFCRFRIFMKIVLQKSLSFAPWMQTQTSKLPGITPVSLSEWIQIDEAYTEQLLLKSELVSKNFDQVHRLANEAIPAAIEVLNKVLSLIPGLGFEINGSEVRRPDEVVVTIDKAEPLLSLAKLIQEDIIILQQVGGEHLLRGACLCFPASWDLNEKFNKPLTQIHEPVENYDTILAQRVERIISSVRPDQPLMRGNVLRYANPELFHPKRNSDLERLSRKGEYIRSERQTLLKMPNTDAVIFSIHSYVIRETDLSSEQVAGLVSHGLS